MLARLFDKISGGPAIPTIRDRMAARSSDFQLISLLPFVTAEGLDMKRPFHYPVHMRPVEEVGPLDRAVWRTAKIACADDICLEAANTRGNVEIRAAGLDLTTREAMMEAARRPEPSSAAGGYEPSRLRTRGAEAEACRYIVFEHPLHKFLKGGLNSVVLENTAAPAGSNKAMVVTMVAPRD
jgi:hypothetical protein